MVELLLSLGVNINNCNQAGFPVIWIAVRYKHLDTVKILVESGADIEMHGMFANFRCLDYAILFGYYEIAQFLYQTTCNKVLKSADEYERYRK
jgi:ankyrin repeat protein